VSPKTLLLYSKPGCHLCQEMKAVVLKVAAEANAPIAEVDISADPALLARYGEEIPVLFIDGRKAFKYRVSEKELRARLARS
jgi:glutaredoxin